MTKTHARRGFPRIGRWLPPLFGLLAAAPGQAQGQSAATPLAACAVPDSVHDGLAGIARGVDGNIGIAALHVESGTRVSLNADRRFPMASVSKLPMALEFLRRVDAGEVDMGEVLRLEPARFRPGSSPLARYSGGRPVSASVDSLFRLMLVVSDNTATDVILDLAGGPDAATRRVRELGVAGVEVNRSEARTFADLVGLPDTIPETELHRYQYFRLRDALPQEYRDAARARYGTDPRDTATPAGMTELLARIHAGDGLSELSRMRLLDAMTDARSGRNRLRGRLPAGTEVAHKTGTMAGAINDVGIITLPDDAGHLILSVFVNTLHRSTPRRERAIAASARLLYDYFGETFSGAAGRVAVGTLPASLPWSACDAQ